MTIDWADLLRMASDPIFDEECMDSLNRVLAASNLTEDELIKLFDVYQTWMTTSNESAPGTDSEDWIVNWDSQVATRLYFDPNTSERVWARIGPNLWWSNQEFRYEIFDELGKRPNTGSKLILHILEMVSKHGNGISELNYEELKKLKYFKQEMLDRLKIDVFEDEDSFE